MTAVRSSSCRAKSRKYETKYTRRKRESRKVEGVVNRIVSSRFPFSRRKNSFSRREFNVTAIIFTTVSLRTNRQLRRLAGIKAETKEEGTNVEEGGENVAKRWGQEERERDRAKNPSSATFLRVQPFPPCPAAVSFDHSTVHLDRWKSLF